VSGVFGAGDLATERVRLECSGDTDVSLAGWTLSDGDKHTFTFPNLDLFPGGAVDVYSRRGTNDVVSLYWGMEAAVWESGETVILKNAAGEIQSTYKVP
jgi:hypothetical protein